MRLSSILIISLALNIGVCLAQPGPGGPQSAGIAGNGQQGPNGRRVVRVGHGQQQCDWGWAMNNNGACQECPPGCLECDFGSSTQGSNSNNNNGKQGNGQVCLQCEKDLCLHQDGTCISPDDCDDGWACLNSVCTQCNDDNMFGQGCMDCDRKHCFECDQTSMMDRWGKSCKPNCDSDEFESNGQCFPCPNGCSMCLSESVCLMCENPDLDPSTGCTSCVCPDTILIRTLENPVTGQGLNKNNNNNNNNNNKKNNNNNNKKNNNNNKKNNNNNNEVLVLTCETCDTLFGANCETCCPERCISCSPEFAVVTNDMSSSCVACSSIGGTGCISCNGTVCLECEEGFFLDTASGSCTPCQTGCDSCTSLVDCTECSICGLVPVSSSLSVYGVGVSSSLFGTCAPCSALIPNCDVCVLGSGDSLTCGACDLFFGLSSSPPPTCTPCSAFSVAGNPCVACGAWGCTNCVFGGTITNGYCMTPD